MKLEKLQVFQLQLHPNTGYCEELSRKTVQMTSGQTVSLSVWHYKVSNFVIHAFLNVDISGGMHELTTLKWKNMLTYLISYRSKTEYCLNRLTLQTSKKICLGKREHLFPPGFISTPVQTKPFMRRRLRALASFQFSVPSKSSHGCAQTMAVENKFFTYFIGVCINVWAFMYVCPNPILRYKAEFLSMCVCLHSQTCALLAWLLMGGEETPLCFE